MNQADLKKLLKKAKPHPIFASLPDSLKDWDGFEAIEKRLTLAVYSDHTHKKISAYVKCKPCAAKLAKKREVLKEIGFASYEQYLEWKRVMDIIINKRDVRIS